VSQNVGLVREVPFMGFPNMQNHKHPKLYGRYNKDPVTFVE